MKACCLRALCCANTPNMNQRSASVESKRNPDKTAFSGSNLLMGAKDEKFRNLVYD